MPRTPKSTDGAIGTVRPKKPVSKPNGNGGNGAISNDDVARKAYEIYESRGGQHGADFDDWIEAEKQLKQGQQQPPAPSERRKRSRAGA